MPSSWSFPLFFNSQHIADSLIKLRLFHPPPIWLFLFAKVLPRNPKHSLQRPARQASSPSCQINNESLEGEKKLNIVKRNKLMAKINDFPFISNVRERKSFRHLRRNSGERRKSGQTSKNYKSLHSDNTLMDSGWKFSYLASSVPIRPPQQHNDWSSASHMGNQNVNILSSRKWKTNWTIIVLRFAQQEAAKRVNVGNFFHIPKLFFGGSLQPELAR